jgi:hypothetical protein
MRNRIERERFRSEAISRVPRKQKINLEKVMGHNTLCLKSGCSITPERIRRVDLQTVECPECGVLTPEKRDGSGQ